MCVCVCVCIQTNIAPVSGRALASSDTSGMSLYTSPY